MIAFFEPQCVGFEHASFNAAMVSAYAAAVNSGTMVRVFGERTHIEEIAPLLLNMRKVELIPVTIASRRARGYMRLLEEWIALRGVFRRLRVSGSICPGLVLLSVTSQTFAAIRMIPVSYRPRRIFAVVHSLLETLVAKRQSRAVWEYPLRLRNVLKYFFPDNVTVVVLGTRVLGRLCQVLLRMRKCARSLEVPYLFAEEYDFEPFANSIVRIGWIGVVHRSKGIDRLIRIARWTNDVRNLQYVVVGYLKDKRIESRLVDNMLVESGGRPLDRERFEELLRSIDYAVFLFEDSSYQLTESASFLDSFSHAKPVLATESELMTEKFHRFGNIGFLCNTDEQLAATIRRICLTLPRNEYQTQRNNMYTARKQISLERVGAALLKMVGENRN
ncbi:MAG: glycosyltransferase [Planctomycetes bacterium]|nr:glycosyltransferase [Planctomycetota bacterium]